MQDNNVTNELGKMVAETDEVNKEADAMAIKYCSKCGEKLLDDQSFCPKCGASQFVFCRNCGAKVKANESFCTKCGNALFEKSNFHLENFNQAFKPTIIKTRISDAILYSLINVVYCVLLYINGFYSYTSSSMLGVEIEQITGFFSFNSLIAGIKWSNTIIVLMMIPIVLVVTVFWICYSKKKAPNVIIVLLYVAEMFIMFFSTFLGWITVDDKLSSIILGAKFNALGPVFYIEIILLIVLMVLSGRISKKKFVFHEEVQ